MEARTKQQQLLFDKGITNVPSDNLCSDNTLAESVGMVYEDGEHRVIQRPVEFITSAENALTHAATTIPTILYVHEFNDEKRFIGWRDTGSILAMVWGTVVGKVFLEAGTLVKPDHTPFVYTNNTKVTSVGKTLVIANENGIFYFLWQAGATDFYKSLGELPEFDFNCWMYLPSMSGLDSVSGQLKYDGILVEGADGLLTWELDAVEAYNDMVVGLYSKNLKEIARKKAFAEPFFVRFALELYDGTYYNISQPVLLFPSVRENSSGMASQIRIGCFELYTHFAYLYLTQRTDFTLFSDIVKNVVVFATEGINLYDLLADQPLTDITSSDIMEDYVYRYHNQTMSEYRATSWNLTEHRYHVLKRREETEIINEIKSKSVFYRLCDLGLSPVNNIDLGEKIGYHTLENLTTQESIEYDDYYSRCPLIPSFIYSYNSRLNLANVKRGFFEGFDFFMPWDQAQSTSYNIYVTIKTDIGEIVVKHTTPLTQQKMGYYFYYPDSRATKVVITDRLNQDAVILNAKLTEHPGLNGAYYFAGLPGDPAPSRATDGGGSTTVSVSPVEVLSNYIIQSEVNNPWVYFAQGYHAVGTGKIIGMSSITQALSEGQFGSYPLLVFSESGIWALSVADTGYYSSIHPMSREVCNNARSITQTDGAVFFTSEKGLMVIVGNQVQCVSEQLSGKQDLYSDAMFPSSVIGNVSNFFRTCYIAYDYRDSLLWIMGNAPGAEHCYIYSIKSGTFSKYHLPQLPRGCVNYYPDYLIQTNPSGKVYSLLQRPNINLDYVGETTNHRQYTATMLTRPMKMENALALKSIMHLKNIKLFSPYTITTTETDPETQEQVSVETHYKGSITFRLFASNDLENWVERTSLRGVPFKYYRFRFDFADLIATDRFAGTVVVTQERRTDKIR